jgi:hypothetical protein
MVCERHVGATGVIPGSAYAIIDMHSLATSKGHNPRLLPPDKLVKFDSFIWIQCRSGWKPKSHLTVGDQVLKLDCSVGAYCRLGQVLSQHSKVIYCGYRRFACRFFKNWKQYIVLPAGKAWILQQVSVNCASEPCMRTILQFPSLEPSAMACDLTVTLWLIENQYQDYCKLVRSFHSKRTTKHKLQCQYTNYLDH